MGTQAAGPSRAAGPTAGRYRLLDFDPAGRDDQPPVGAVQGFNRIAVHVDSICVVSPECKQRQWAVTGWRGPVGRVFAPRVDAWAHEAVAIADLLGVRLHHPRNHHRAPPGLAGHLLERQRCVCLLQPALGGDGSQARARHIFSRPVRRRARLPGQHRRTAGDVRCAGQWASRPIFQAVSAKKVKVERNRLNLDGVDLCDQHLLHLFP